MITKIKLWVKNFFAVEQVNLHERHPELSEYDTREQKPVYSNEPDELPASMQCTPNSIPTSVDIPSIALCFGNNLSFEDTVAICNTVKNLNWQPEQVNDLMACIAFETGGSFDPAQKNFAGSSATGLIQFMPKTAMGLGTSVSKLERMTFAEQLHYVELHFRPWAKRIKTLEDMYMAILLPKYIGYSADTVIINLTTHAKRYLMNKGLDLDKDGGITIEEATSRVRTQLNWGLSYPNSKLIVKSLLE